MYILSEFGADVGANRQVKWTLEESDCSVHACCSCFIWEGGNMTGGHLARYAENVQMSQWVNRAYRKAEDEAEKLCGLSAGP